MPAVSCEYCHTVFEVKKYLINMGQGRFCKRQCYEALRAVPVVVCGYCQQPFKARENRIHKGYGKYCKQACYFAAKRLPGIKAREEATAILQSNELLFRCPQCTGWKKLSDFGANKGKPNGRHPWCKECLNRKNLSRRHADLLLTRAKERKRAKNYRLKYPDKIRLMKLAHYIRRKKAPFVERVDIEVLIQRDGGRCSLCYKKVKRRDATIDHIQPLTKGGEHSYKNCSLAHRSCNSRKNNRLIGQMRLF